MQLTAVCTVSIYIITCPYRNHVYFIFEVLLCLHGYSYDVDADSNPS